MKITPLMERAANRAKRFDRLGRIIVFGCGVFLIVLTVGIAAFLLYKGVGTFTVYGHTPWEFITSPQWKPRDTLEPLQPGEEPGSVGAAVYIVGSLVTCLLGLAFALPFSIGAAVFLTEIAPKISEKLFRPAVELFLGIPSVVYGWIGFNVLVTAIDAIFHTNSGGFSVLAAGIVLAVMIFPTITTVSADAIRAVNDEYRIGAYGLGSTRWQVIYRVVLPAAKTGIFTGVILGLARAFGEALAVAMVVGKSPSFPHSLLDPTATLTTAITADVTSTAQGGEFNLALWTMALLLFIISLLFIVLIHAISRKKKA